MEIQRSSEVPWRYRLFDSLIVFQNYLVDDAARRLSEKVQIEDFVAPIHTNYPVLLLAEPGERLRLTLIYDRKSVAAATIERWRRDLEILLELAPVFFDKRVGELQALLSPRSAQLRKRGHPRQRCKRRISCRHKRRWRRTSRRCGKKCLGWNK